MQKHDQTSLASYIQQARHSTQSGFLCYQSSPKESHLATIKMIIKYIPRSSNLGLWCANNTTLGFFYYTTLQEVDFTLGATQLHYILLSTMKVDQYRQILHSMNWIKQMIKDSGIKCNTMFILCNNTSAINASISLSILTFNFSILWSLLKMT